MRFSCLVFPLSLHLLFHFSIPTTPALSVSLFLSVSGDRHGIAACAHHPIIFSNANREWQPVNKMPFSISYFYCNAHTQQQSHICVTCLLSFTRPVSLLDILLEHQLSILLPASLSLRFPQTQTPTDLQCVQLLRRQEQLFVSEPLASRIQTPSTCFSLPSDHCYNDWSFLCLSIIKHSSACMATHTCIQVCAHTSMRRHGIVSPADQHCPLQDQSYS